MLQKNNKELYDKLRKKNVINNAHLGYNKTGCLEEKDKLEYQYFEKLNNTYKYTKPINTNIYKYQQTIFTQATNTNVSYISQAITSATTYIKSFVKSTPTPAPAPQLTLTPAPQLTQQEQDDIARKLLFTSPTPPRQVQVQQSAISIAKMFISPVPKPITKPSDIEMI